MSCLPLGPSGRVNSGPFFIGLRNYDFSKLQPTGIRETRSGIELTGELTRAAKSKIVYKYSFGHPKNAFEANVTIKGPKGDYQLVKPTVLEYPQRRELEQAVASFLTRALLKPEVAAVYTKFLSALQNLNEKSGQGLID